MNFINSNHIIHIINKRFKKQKYS